MLFENEKIDFEKKGLSQEKLSDDDINLKYLKGEVRIVTEQARYPLNTILGLINSQDYELNPDFQRRHRWDTIKKSKLIESFIMNIPIPPVFLYENELSHYEVMDGLQRLSTICEFYENKFELAGLQIWSELNGRNYSSLPENVRKGIDRRFVSAIILLQESARSNEDAIRMKQMVFERLNSGGVKLEPQETRNAIYDGPMNKLCLRLSRNSNLCHMLQLPVGNPDIDEQLIQELNAHESYRKMQDVEFVLRYFAMRQREGYSGTLSPFLDKYLDEANKFDPSVLSALENNFVETMDFAEKLLGDKVCLLYRKKESKDGSQSWSWGNKIAAIVYDSLMQVLSELLSEKEFYYSLGAEEINSALESFYKENEAAFVSRDTSKSSLETRISLYRNFFENLKRNNTNENC